MRPPDLGTRIGELLVALALVIYLTVGAPPVVFRAAVGALVFGAAWEATSIALAKSGRTASVLAGAGAVLLHLAWVRIHEAGIGPAIALFGGAGITFLLAVARVAGAGGRGAWRHAALSIASILVVCGIPLAYLVLLPGAWVLFAVAVSWASDIGGYVGGNLWGKRPVFPSISPRKTLAGIVSGWVLATAVALVMHARFQYAVGWVPLALVAFAAAILSQVGDLLESWFKRRHGVKDSGRLLPATGGVLDAIDGISAVAPFLYFIAPFAMK
jgi:phosphatidate cytidylyltransferase